MMDVEYLRRTRRITYARYVRDSRPADAAELGTLNAFWVDGSMELIVEGIQVAPFSVERYEPDINAMVRIGTCFYFVYLGYR